MGRYINPNVLMNKGFKQLNNELTLAISHLTQYVLITQSHHFRLKIFLIIHLKYQATQMESCSALDQ